MNKIEINNLSLEQLNDLEEQIKKQKEGLTTYGRKRVEGFELYFYLGDNGIISSKEDTYNYGDNNRFNIGNYYTTKEKAEEARDRQLAIVRVNDAIDKLNGYWDYKNGDIYYTIFYDTINKNGTNFNSHKRVFILNEIKSEEIAKQIISEYENDLKLIFNIK